jgi:O-antigen/teichoic acid export membrane protein
MLRRFFTDSAYYGITGILSRGISIFLVPFYTRVFTPADYGIIDLIAIIGAIVGIVVPMEITQAVALFYSDAEEKDQKKLVASVGLFYTLLTFLIFGLLGLAFSAPIVNSAMAGIITVQIFRMAVISMVFQGLYYFIQNQIRWRLEPKSYSLVAIGYTITTISLTIFFVLFRRTGIVGVFYAQILGGLFASVLGFLISRDSYGFLFRKKLLFSMLKFSIPLVPSGIGVFFINYAQRIQITKLLTLTDLGLFGIGTRIASMLTVVNQGFQGSVAPLIYNNYKKENTPVEIVRIFKAYLFFALVFIVALSVFSRELLIILTTKAYYSAYIFVPFLLADRFFSETSVFFPGLALAKKTKIIAIINICGAAVAIGISFMLVSRFGTIGAAVGSMSTSILLFFVNFNFSQKYYRVPHPVGLYAILIGLATATILIAFLIPHMTLLLTIGLKGALLLLFIIIIFFQLLGMDRLIAIIKTFMRKSKQ